MERGIEETEREGTRNNKRGNRKEKEGKKREWASRGRGGLEKRKRREYEGRVNET